MSRRALLIVGLAALAVSLLLQMPAALVYSALKPKDPPPKVELFGLEGNLRAGRIDGVASQGRTVLTDLRWHFRPLPLLLARLGFQVSAINGPVLLDGYAALSPTGRLRLKDFRINAGLRSLLAGLGYPFLPVDGQAGLELRRLQAHEGRLEQIEGVLELRGLAWALGAVPTPLGDYRAELATEDGQSVARLSSLGGPLEVSGEARLQPDQRYTLDLRLRARPGAPPMVNNLLQQLGPADAQGYHRLQRSGSLQPAGAAS